MENSANNLRVCETFLAETAIVIVLYKVKLLNTAIFNSLQAACSVFTQHVELIVYDNSPAPSDPGIVEGFNIKYIHDFLNPGISTAYNVAADYAIGLNKTRLLIYDQDTCVNENTILKYADAVYNHKNIKLFAPILLNQFGKVISPSKFRLRMGIAPGKLIPGINYLKDLSPVNSGICIDLKLFAMVNGYNQAIPLDYSDYDFIERIQNFISEFVLLDLYFQHNLSASESQTFTSALTRFKFLCIGLRESSKSTCDKNLGFCVGLKRALKLALVHKNLTFIKILFNEFG
jgi:rhamnosyltransferase